MVTLAVGLIRGLGGLLSGVVGFPAFSWRHTVPCGVALTALPAFVTGKSHRYPPRLSAVRADALGLVLTTSRHHLTPPSQWAVVPLMSERALSRGHYNGGE